MALGNFLNDYFRGLVPRQTTDQDAQALMASLFSGQPQDHVNITPRMTAPDPSSQALMNPTAQQVPTQPMMPNMQPMGADNPQLAQRAAAGAYNGPIAPLMQGPQADQLKALLSRLSPQAAMPLLSGLANNVVSPPPPIIAHEGDTFLNPKTFAPVYTAPPKSLTPNEKVVQTQNDYNTLDSGSNDIAKAMAPTDVGLGSTAPGLSWVQRQKAFADEQLKKNNPNQPFNDDGTPNKAYQDYKLKEVGAEAAARSAATNGTGLGADGKAIGTLGSPTIDATAPDYASAIVGGTGLTQASIDQKAINYITAGTLPPQGRTGMAGTQNAAISNRMAEIAPNGNLAVNKTKLKSYSESLAQQQKYLDTTQRALNTANDTLDSLEEYMKKNNINPSQFPDFNRFSNYLKSKGLDPGAAGGYNAQLATLRAEYSQVLAKGGVRSVETDREAAKLVPDGLSPAALAQVAAQIRVDGDNVTRDAQKQVTQISDQLNGALSGHGAQPAASTNGPPRIKDAADYAKLPPGPYIDPNGVARVKK